MFEALLAVLAAVVSSILTFMATRQKTTKQAVIDERSLTIGGLSTLIASMQNEIIRQAERIATMEQTIYSRDERIEHLEEENDRLKQKVSQLESELSAYRERNPGR